jgi:hypothetical protein
MNYIEAYKKKFNKEPTEDEIAIMMQSVAVEDQENAKHRSMKFKPKGFAANCYKDCRGAVTGGRELPKN